MRPEKGFVVGYDEKPFAFVRQSAIHADAEQQLGNVAQEAFDQVSHEVGRVSQGCSEKGVEVACHLAEDVLKKGLVYTEINLLALPFGE